MPPRLIVVPVDFSHESRAALHYAIALAADLDASIHLLHSAYVFAPWSVRYIASLRRAQDRVREAGARLLQEAADEVRHASIRVEVHLTDERPEKSIPHLAEVLHADLIVMGTHGFGGVTRLVLGSVTQKVVRDASCPVLTLSPHCLDRAENGSGEDSRVA